MNEQKNVLSNFIWRFAERTGAQLVSFVVSILLARLLDPDAYGTIALVTVMITVLNVFVDSGLGNALIQKKDADDIDYSTVFTFNIFLCSVLYTVMFLVAPYISRFYNDPLLVSVIRVLSLTVVISGVKNIQIAYISSNMQFRKFFFATLGGTIGAAVIGVLLAFWGYGVWALVIQQVFNTLVDTIILWITVEWRPKFAFSFQRLKGLFEYGWKLLCSNLINTIYGNIRQLIIGRIYTTSDLAQYNRGRQFPDIIITNINTSIDSVLLPVMSKEQDDRSRVKAMTRRAIKISTYIIAPLMIGLSVCGEPIVRLVLTDKWLPCVPFMRIFCITYIFYPIHTANLNAIKAMGRSNLFLKLEIWKKIIGLIILVCTMRLGVMTMAYSLLITSVISQLINSWPNKKLLNYGYFEQLKDILPGILIAIVMGVCVLPVQYFNLSDIVILIIQVPLGAAIFIGLSAIFHLDSFYYLWNIVKTVPNKFKHK